MAIRDARGGAVALMTAVTGEGRLLAEVEGLLAPLDPQERARALRLATSGLRFATRIDRILGPYLRSRPPEEVLNILRLAVLELGQGGAAHGVVHSAVSATRRVKGGDRLAGMVNAVLRRVAENDAPGWAELPPPPMVKALGKRLARIWGKERLAAMEAVFAGQPPLDLTPKNGDAAALAALTGGQALPTGSVRLTDPGQISLLPGYETGDWWVQDAAAAIPARVLAVAPGEAALDLCAAPGGKTMQLAAAGARVTAVDVSADRMRRVADNLARTGLQARCVTSDALKFTESHHDAILLDAPCSATGTIRRHPDLPHVKAAADFAELVALQARMLAHAATLLKPGGRLVYCTCSLLPEEGEAQVEAFAAAHPQMLPDPAATDLPGLDPAWHADPGQLRILPDTWADRGGIDGFFIAAFRHHA